MHTLVAIGEIKLRAEAIGVSLKVLARAAGVHPSTAYRSANGQYDSRVSTLRKLSVALELREARCREHLLRQRPSETPQ